ncbi:MAG: murein biosynthesis integral membrane protein MurJ [Deinococcota bacterium]|nr:murein biosynthesis integral membrane protein MurJ [Deinococcota bacterium]
MNVRGTLSPRRSGARGALTLMVGTLFSRLSGLLRQTLMVNLFAQEVLAAFLVATRIPNLFRELLAEGALTNSFVPVYRSLPPGERRELSGALLKLLLGVNAVLVAVAIWAAPWVVGLLLGGTTTDIDYGLTVALARLVFPFLAAISLAALAMGILNAEERFWAPAWAPVAFNLVTIALMLLFPGGATTLAVAFVVGGVAQLLVQLPALFGLGVFPSPTAWWHKSLGRVLALAVPFTFTTGARQLLNLVAYRVLNTLPSASANVVAFENANLVFMLALALFSVSPAVAFFSRLSADAHEAPEAFATTLLSGLRLISFLTIPAGLVVILLAGPAIETLFNWSNRTDADYGLMLRLSVFALMPLGLAVFPWGVNNLLIRPFYIRENIRTPIIINVIFISLNALLYYLLAPRYGLAGMSWSTVAVGWLQLTVLLLWMRKGEGLDLAAFTGHAVRVWLAALGGAGLGYLALLLLPFPAGWPGFVLQVVAGGAVAGLGFAVAAALLRLPELEQVLRRLRR